MAKQVNLTVKIDVNGMPLLTQASFDAKELSSALGGVGKQAKKAVEDIGKLADFSVLATNMQMAFRNIASECKVLTDAYQLQMESETKLETVMRQRMNATAGDIQAMKDLASAQQQVGIIGDEVTLMGMQQLATFVNQRQTLEQLTPAMLNLLAQQKGFNATANDSVAIANLFGKAMQGNASALTRVGITMSDAQKEALKTGTEMERAALLSEIVTQNVGEMNEKLAQTDAGKAKQIANAFGDWQEQIGAAIMPFQTLITQIGSLGEAANTFVMLGSGALAATKSIWEFTGKMGLANLSMRAGQGVARGMSSAVRALGISLTFGEKSAKALSVAIRGVVSVGGIYLAIEALGYACEYLGLASSKAAESTDDLRSSQEKISQKYAEVQANLVNDIAALKDFKGTQEEEKATVERLNSTYGATLGYFSSVSQWYDALVKDSESYCRQMLIEIRIAQRRAMIEKLMADKNKIIYDEDGNKKKYSTERPKKGGRMWAVGGNIAGDNIPEIGKEVYGPSELDKANARIKTINGTIAKLLAENADDMRRAQSVTHAVTGSRTRPETVATPKGVGGGKGRAVSTPKASTSQTPDKEPEKTEEEILREQLEKAQERVMKAESALKTFRSEMDAKNADIGKRMKDPDADHAAIAKEVGDLLYEALKGEVKASAEFDDALKDFNTLQEKVRPRLEEIEKLKTALSAPLGEPATLQDLDDWLSYLNTLAQRADATRLPAIMQQIEKLTKARDAMERAAKPAPDVDAATDVATIDSAIQFYSDQQQHADADRIFELQGIIDSLTRRRAVLTFGMELPEMEKTLAEIDALTGRERRIRIEALGLDAIEEQMKRLRKLLDDTENPLTPEMQKHVEELLALYGKFGGEIRKTNKEAAKTAGVSQAASAIDNLGQSVSRMSAENKALAASMTVVSLAASLTQLVASMVEKASKAVTIWDWIAGVAAGTATVISAAASLKGIGAFADGGVVSGPTLALVGEYAGATNNPEVIAPLSKLRSMIDTGESGGGQVEFVISERKLRGVLRKGARHKSRM